MALIIFLSARRFGRMVIRIFKVFLKVKNCILFAVILDFIMLSIITFLVVMEQNENTSSQIRFWYDWKSIKEECTGTALKHTNVSKRFFSEKCTNTHWLSKRSKLGRFENAILVTKLLIHSILKMSSYYH